MLCSKCGVTNNPESKFCVGCGNPLEVHNQNNYANPKNIETLNTNFVNTPSMPNQNSFTNNTMEKNKGSFNYTTYIVSFLLKPIKTFQKEEEKVEKNSFVFALLIAIAMMLCTLITTIIATIHVKQYVPKEGYKYGWEFSNMKEIDFLPLIGKNFLIYVGILFVIAFVFYVASLIIKKDLSFQKSLSIATTSIIPAVVGGMILSPILGKIWSPLGIVFTIVGMVYTLILLYELINSSLELKEDQKIYFNLICFCILLISFYFAYMKLFVGDIESIFNLLS